MTPSDPLQRQMKNMADKRLAAWVVWIAPRGLMITVCYTTFQLMYQPDISDSAVFVLLAYASIFLVGTVKPHWMTSGVFLAYHAGIIGTMIYHVYSENVRCEYLGTNFARIAGRFMLSLVHADPTFSLILNFAYAAAISQVSFLHSLDLRQELSVSLYVTLGALVSAWSRDAEFLARLEAKTARNFESIADGLLSSMCDAVVHLSKDLKLSKPCEHLSAMLLRSSSDMRVGFPFISLALDTTEKDRLSRFLSRPMSETYSIQVTFRDAWGIQVKLELFHARGVDMHDELIHIVGLKEDSEVPRAPRPGVLNPSLVEPNSTGLISIAEDSINCSGSLSSSSLTIDRLGAEMCVQISPREDGIRVLGCSAEFSRLCGPVFEDTQFLRWVINDVDFLAWAARASESLMDAHHGHSMQHDEPTSQPLRILLDLPHMGCGVRYVSANASMQIQVQEDDGSGAVPSPEVFLLLDDLVFERGEIRRLRGRETLSL